MFFILSRPRSMLLFSLFLGVSMFFILSRPRSMLPKNSFLPLLLGVVALEPGLWVGVTGVPSTFIPWSRLLLGDNTCSWPTLLLLLLGVPTGVRKFSLSLSPLSCCWSLTAFL